MGQFSAEKPVARPGQFSVEINTVTISPCPVVPRNT